MHVYELFLPQLNPKPGIFLQTRRAFSTEPQGDQLPLSRPRSSKYYLWLSEKS